YRCIDVILFYLFATVLCSCLFFFLVLSSPRSPLFPYTTLFRSWTPARASTRSSLRMACQPAMPFFRAMSSRTWPEKRASPAGMRSEEHTSELQSRFDLVCRLLLEKKKNNKINQKKKKIT